jgi:hypothetical protein
LTSGFAHAKDVEVSTSETSAPDTSVDIRKQIALAQGGALLGKIVSKMDTTPHRRFVFLLVAQYPRV